MRDDKSCSEIKEKLLEYLDGRVRPAERHMIDEHLTACADCRARVEEFRMLWSALDDVPSLSPSAAFDASLRARIAAEPVRHGFWNWLPSPRLAFAVTALVAMSVWVSFMPRVSPNQSRSSDKVSEQSVLGTAQISVQSSSQISADADFGMIRDLPVLENYDVLSKFDALSELPSAPGAEHGDARKENR